MDTTGPMHVRIAPSPTGDPHVGTAYVALINYVLRHKYGGAFILRIEDTDRVRSTLAAEAAIMRSLHWTGLSWDEGPDVGGPGAPYRQSERSHLYRRYSDVLVAKDAAYECFCTPERLAIMRAEQEARKEPPRYDRACLRLSAEERQARVAAGEPHVIRFRMPDEGEITFTDLIRGDVTFKAGLLDDQVLLKSDGFPTYHLANVVDDHLMGVNLVCRAEEWLPSTPKHILLYQAFGWDVPAWAHLSLLRNADRSKISKRKNPVSLVWYETEGFLPEALLNFLGLMLFSIPGEQELFSVDDFIREFSWDRVIASGPVFDLEKLTWLNGVYIRKLSSEELFQRLGPWLPHGADPVYVTAILPLIQDRLRKLGEFEELTDFFFEDTLEYDHALLIPKKSTREAALAGLTAALERLAEIPAWEHDPLEAAMRALAVELGVKAGDLFMSLRVAVTGKTATPPLFETMVVLGRARTLDRIRVAVDRLR